MQDPIELPCTSPQLSTLHPHDSSDKITLHPIPSKAKGYVPLIVPITLMNHYVRKYREPYLKQQYYFNPYPVELMLRNHA
jgi:uncharacterized protein YbgA (DUF1722 family)